jgi:hypothetical protein
VTKTSVMNDSEESDFVFKKIPQHNLIPDHVQKSATTRRRRERSPADLATMARSSANPQAGDRRPEMVRCPTPVALRARSRALNTSLKRRGEHRMVYLRLVAR